MAEIISLDAFKAPTDIERFATAMKYLRENPNTTFVIPAGVYNISTPLAVETMNDVLSGKHGENPEKFMFSRNYKYSVGVSFEGQSGTTVVADGATLMVNGFMEPLSLKNCENIKISGLTIDHLRKPYSKGTAEKLDIDESGEGSVTVLFGDEYPLNENSPMPRTCFYDEYAAHFVGYGEVRLSRREFLGGNCFRFYGKGMKKNMLGMYLYAWHTFHSRPAILIENAKNITLENVSIHSQPGMGVVAHRSENLLFSALNVVPSVGEHISTNTDATHITSCRGTVRCENCRFEGQGDDSINIHTYYQTPTPLGGKKYRLVNQAPTGTHSQSLDYPDEGDILELTQRGTLGAIGSYKVVSSAPNPEGWYTDVELDKALPPDTDYDKILFANVSQCPRLELVGSWCHSHFGRGALIKTKWALIENNCFDDVIGTAIHVAAEEYWYEGLCTTEDIQIRRNRILFCGRTNDIRERNCAGICVTITADNPTEPTHKRVVIEDNIVDVPDSPHAIFVSNTADLTLRRNAVRSKNEPIITE